jgi:hypothetical protein
MVFAPDTEVALRTVVNLINSAANGTEGLGSAADLDQFLAAEGFTGSRTRDDTELASVHRLRQELGTPMHCPSWSSTMTGTGICTPPPRRPRWWTG